VRGFEKRKSWKKTRRVSNLPVEQQQQRQHGQIGGGHVGILLETHEDDDDQCGRDDVVTLQEGARKRVNNSVALPFYQDNSVIVRLSSTGLHWRVLPCPRQSWPANRVKAARRWWTAGVWLCSLSPGWGRPQNWQVRRTWRRSRRWKPAHRPTSSSWERRGRKTWEGQAMSLGKKAKDVWSH